MSAALSTSRLHVLRELLLRIEDSTSPFYSHSGGIRVASLFVEEDASSPRPRLDVTVLLQHLRRLREAVEDSGDAEVLRLTLASIEAAEELWDILAAVGPA